VETTFLVSPQIIERERRGDTDITLTIVVHNDLADNHVGDGSSDDKEVENA